jgi:hypothetical protein
VEWRQFRGRRTGVEESVLGGSDRHPPRVVVKDLVNDA